MAMPRDAARTPLERTPPQNVELEQAVLGAVMIDPKDAFPLVQDHLTPDSFYLDGHGLIFELMGEMYARGIPPDSVTLLDELKSRGQLERIGGSAYLMALLNQVATSANVEYHARKVAEKAHLRALIRACTQVIEECYRQELPLEQVLDQAESSVLQLSTHATSSEFHAIATVLAEYWEKLSSRDLQLREMREAGVENPHLSMGLPSGFADLDVMTGGLRQSELTIIAARPSMGKTALALNMMQNIAVKEGIPCALFSLEMGASQLAERMLCMGTKYWQNQRIRGISSNRLQNPDMDDREWNVLTQAYEQLVQAPVYIDDSSLLSSQMLKSKARRLYAHHNIQLIIVDYLQLMSGGNSENRVQEVSEISRGLKQIARELKIPVVALSQLSRQVESRTSKRPQLSDLRESGAIEQDADVVMFIHRPDYYEEKQVHRSGDADYDQYSLPEAQLIVAKNRNGPTGTAEMYFFPEITRFLDKSGR